MYFPSCRLKYIVTHAISKLNPPGLIVITGCGRSGTTYVSELLQALDLDVGHEKLGKDGISSWFNMDNEI